ncbi:MAG: GAF domain-containing sensor histidine kinase [Roseiflexaceae bacterium]|nr:GAF domain-containing sensor histidine kinase [Roseiflexaceae bacterium]
MLAGNRSSVRVWPWATIWRRLLYSLAPAASLVIAWWIAASVFSVFIWAEAVAFCLCHLALIALRRLGLLRLQVTVGLGLLVDLVMSSAMIAQAGQLGMGFFPLYGLITLRALSVYRLTPAATIIPFILGPVYLFAQAANVPLSQLPPDARLASLLLLLGSLGFGVAAIWASTATVRANYQLQHNLRHAQGAADLRVNQLERSANDLRARMREQHALEEGLRVITSSLSLDEVLRQIVDSTMQMLGHTRAHGVALSLWNGSRFEHRSSGSEARLAPNLLDALAKRAIVQQVPLIINDLSNSDDTLDVQFARTTALSVPLFVGDASARGALTVVGHEHSAFDSVDARHLSALAIQAGIAIQNAELHSQMLQQRQLLEAVMRDITEGMVVLNGQFETVLTNPLGRRLMDVQANSIVRTQVVALAETMRSEGKHIMAREIRTNLADDEAGGTYQAWASLVRQHGSDEPLVAIVLHDISDQKADEKGKQEFISMVAHELRNPLHSMNGFVKIVLAGKVGGLTDMQQEFLGIVDSQIALLNGRISELLEYNRYQAGRMSLNPQYGDIPILVAGTVTRLRLLAENSGLTLINSVAVNLPECYFDGERIGQVLTNLIENAIKATPPGGQISVASELHEDELWLRVYDTGIGISEEDRAKIFQAFYRAHDRSSKGNHLGLGLAICAQIVEGHRGRIWVESEVGKGSCFSIALPVVSQERSIGEFL